MKFEVDTGQLSSTVKSLEDTLTGISDGRLRMFQAIEALEGMWVGEAHDAFQVQYSNDNELMIALVQELSSVFGQFGTARQSYDTCEQSVKETINSIRI